MILFHSLPALCLLALALLLTLLGRSKNGASAFCGALFAIAAALCALLEGGGLQEALLYVLIVLWCAWQGRSEGRNAP